MEEVKLDQLLKDKWVSLESHIPKDAWENFAEKLKDTELNDNIFLEKKFDQNIYDKLNPFIPPSKEKHVWANFYDYYSRVKGNENNVLWFKAMEITIAFLVVVTFFQIDFKGKNIESTAILPSKELAKIGTPTKNVEQENRPITVYAGFINPSLENSSVANSKKRVLFQVEKIPKLKQVFLEKPSIPIYLNSFSEVKQIPSLTSLNIPARPRKININTILDFGKWHLTLLSGFDGDNVHTPENARFKVPETIRNSSGFHVGFLLSEGSKRLETGFGFLFAHKEYNAPKITFIQGSLREGYTSEQLKKIKLNILQIPVFSKFNILQGDKWRVFASLGTAAHLTLSANYFIVHPGFLPSSVLLTGKSNSVYQNLEEGLLQGGNIMDNVYFSMDFGVGVEKIISSKTSFFVQPNYQHFVGHVNKGIGPYDDRISSVSIRTGLRVNLFATDK